MRAIPLLCVLTFPVVGQADWSAANTPVNPSQPFHTAMAHDISRNRTVLFGGTNNAVNFGETWEYDGVNWVQMSPTMSPSPRYWPRMAYDAVRGVCVLFGGNVGSGETWEYDGLTWTLRTPATQPPARFSQGMWYDLARARVMMFGGNERPTGVILNDTWAWDGTDWTQQFPATQAPPLWSIDVAYDLSRDRAVIFGGADVVTSATNETWEWDGSNWSQVITPHVATPRWGNKVAYSLARQRVVMVGGRDAGGAVADTWEYDGYDWHEISTPTNFTPRENHSVVYDLARSTIVAYGGFPPVNDTWEYTDRSPGMFVPYGVGCAGSAGVPTLDAQLGSVPLVGQAFTMEVDDLPAGAGVVIGIVGVSKTVDGSTPLPFGLAPLGMPGCSQFVGDFILVQLLVAAATPVPWSITLPNDNGFVGFQLFPQVVVPDAGANPLGVIVSNAGEATIG